LKGLSQSVELFNRDTKLAQNLEKEWRADFAAAVEGDGDSTAVRMVPPLMAAGLPCLGKSQEVRDTLRFASRRASTAFQ